MELIQLSYFQKVAELENFSSASEELFITQPALSKSIINLESELGVKLFDRIKGKVSLNKNGDNLLVHTKRIFAEIESIEAEFLEQANQDKHTVRFSNVLTILAKDIINTYMLKNMEVHIFQMKMSPEQSRKKLLKGEIDFAICFSPIQDEMVAWKHLFFDPNYAALPKNHPLAQRQGICLSELKNERFLLNNQHEECIRLIMDQCKAAGFIPNVVYEGNNFNTIEELAMGGYGIFLIAKSVANFLAVTRGGRLSGMVLIKIEDACCGADVGIATFKGKPLSSEAQKLCNYIIENLSSYK
jgi:DNA-binding transcriptional LysR family regulator